MDLGPEGLRDTPETGRDDSEALIRRWHQRNCQEHGAEVQRLLDIARNDHLHG